MDIRMKNITIICLLIVVCIGCNQTNPPKNRTEAKLKNDTLKTEVYPEVKGDFTIYEHDLSLYNEKYLLQITPAIETLNNKYESHILLTKKSDTIFNKRINIDSLGRTILRYKIFADSAEYSKIATDYELRKIVYHGVRTNDLFFVADIVSIEGTKSLKVKFQLSYFGKYEIGKLFVNGFIEKGWERWGKNAGEIENARNRKIMAP